jgi:hypothetical protein
MDLDREKNLQPRPEHTVDYREPERDKLVHDREEGGRSSFLAFLVGGLVIAVGLLAFLFYDGGARDVTTTGSIGAVERPAGGVGGYGTGTGVAGAGPAAPATPAR